MPLYLMSPPRLDWRLRGRANPFSQAARPEPDALGAQAVRDWLTVADAIVDAGGEVVVMPAPADATLTGMPYTAEAGVLGRDARGPLFLLADLTPAHRTGERAHVQRFFEALGVRCHTVQHKWEGQGDVLRVDAHRVVCTSGAGAFARSSASAFDEVAPLLGAPALHVRFRADPWFHGNTFFGVLGAPGQQPMAWICTDALDADQQERLRDFLHGMAWVPISRAESLAYATNALQVGRVVLAPEGMPPRLAALVDQAGLQLRRLSLPALFSSGGGAAVCLTNRLDGLSLRDVPAWAHFATARSAIAAGVP